MKNTNIKNNLLTQTFKTPGLNRYKPNHSYCFDITPGLLYPVILDRVIPAGRYKWNLQTVVQALVARNPILNGFVARVSAFFVPYRLYNKTLRTNYANPSTAGFADSKFPRFSVMPRIPSMTYYDVNGNKKMFQTCVAPGSLLNCLHFPVNYANDDYSEPLAITKDDSTVSVNSVSATRYINAVDILGYYDIFRNYYMNVADTAVYYVAPGDYSLNDDWNTTTDVTRLRAEPTIEKSTLFAGNFETLLNNIDAVSGLDVAMFDLFKQNLSSSELMGNIGELNILSCVKNGGLMVKSRPMDLVNARVDSYRYQTAISRSLVKISNGVLNMQDLVDGRRLYDYFLKDAYTARFDQWIKAEFGIDILDKLDIPVFLRTWSLPLNFGSMIASASGGSDVSSSAVGEQYGVASPSSRNMTLKFNSKEYGTVMLIVSVEPDYVYSQGVDPFAEKTVMSDMFTPSFDRMGMQGVPADRISWLWNSRNVPNSKSYATEVQGYQDYVISQGQNSAAQYIDDTSIPTPPVNVGYQPTWCEYTNSYSRCFGSFGDPNDVMSAWVAQPFFDYRGVTLSPYLAQSQTNTSGQWIVMPEWDNTLDAAQNPADALRPFSWVSANSSPFIAAINVACDHYLPISSNQISHL